MLNLTKQFRLVELLGFKRHLNRLSSLSDIKHLVISRRMCLVMMVWAEPRANIKLKLVPLSDQQVALNLCGKL